MRALLAIALISTATVWADDTPADAASVDVRVVLDPPVVPFHRPARYQLIVEVTGDVEVKMPDLLEEFAGIEVHDVERATEAIKGGHKRITDTYILDPVLKGTYAIAPAKVQWGPDAKTIIVPSPALRVRDLTEEELAAAERFEPNAGPLSVTKPFWLAWWFWAASGVATVGLVAGMVLLLKRRRKAEREVPSRPAWEIAYERLRELDERQLARAGKFEPYYVDLSAILRYYIEDRFRLHAPEQTTPEFLDAAARRGTLSDQHQRIVADFLRHCDRVKFARYEPTVEQMEKSFEVVLRFVDETVPEPERAPAETEAEAVA
ncbi:MAG TPA: hypothetical protein PLO37_11300 [Candidatus Hydrogenedentes bacterium]|nr:hypothetical protein [Candidatus Hydrogenedentota bacterium]HPG67425.1 hypothetical protein [Candidatus Hydrogenedentota bacterium]